MHQQLRTAPVVTALLSIICLLTCVGCGGGGSSNVQTVAAIYLTPTQLSMNKGTVIGLSAVGLNAAGLGVAATITFTSSNPSVATVSSGGLVCAGVWDSSIINCNIVSGAAGVGQVTITATSGSVTATATVYVHESVDRLEVNPFSSCTTMGQSIPVVATALNTSAPGCSISSPCDITSTVGPIAYASNSLLVAASAAGIDPTYSLAFNSPIYVSGGTITGSKGQTCNLTNFNGVSGATATVTLTGSNVIAGGSHLTVTNPGFGGVFPPTTATLSNGTASCSGTATVNTRLNGNVMLTAQAPGSTTVYAKVSNINSAARPYETCRVTSIKIHSATDNTTNFTLNPTQTQPLTADVLDSLGNSIAPPLTWAPATNAVATVTGSPATITAVEPGAATVTATCTPPSCNINLGAQYGQNVVTVNVTGTTITTVFVGATNSKTLIPINTSTDTAGTAITLPNVPTSITSDPTGNFLYIGSAAGVMLLNLSTNAITNLGGNGTIIATSADGNHVLLSDSVANAVNYLTLNPQAVHTDTGNTTSSSAYTPDSQFNEWVTGDQLISGFQNNDNTTMLNYTANSLAFSAAGGLTYIASSSGNEIDVRSTCNQTEIQQIPANAPTLAATNTNGTGAVAADSPGIDVVTTPVPVSPGCPPTTNTSTLNTFDLGAGPFNASSIFMSRDGSNAWILSDLTKVLNFNLGTSTPTIIPLANNATPLSGGITSDGSRVYVGGSDGLVHRIDLSSLTDATQITVGLKDTGGNATVPNLVFVDPH